MPEIGPVSDRSALVAGTRALLNAIDNWQGGIFILDWDGTQGYLPIIRRSVLRRQLDSLAVAVELVESNRGYAAVSLLRPACEELFWLRYFNGLSSADATELASCLIASGLLRDLNAQAGEVGATAIEEMGLSKTLVALQTEEPLLRHKLAELGSRLAWPHNVTTRGETPTTWFIAKSTGSEDLYRFLYHATSRHVHFSPVELARRGWGRSGRLKIDSATYEPVWAQFSLAWGARLFVLTLSETLEALVAEGVQEPPHEALQCAADAIGNVPLIPLVIPDELAWKLDE